MTGEEARPAGSTGEGGASRARLGVSIYSYSIRPKALPAGSGSPPFQDPLSFLEHCRRLGAGGIQVSLGIRSPEEAADLRRKAVEYGMYLEGEARLPRDEADAGRFEAELRTARDAGAAVLRIAAGNRRYEEFTAQGQFREFAGRTWSSLRIAAPLAARHGVRLAIENHKDFLVPELLEMLRRLGSEHVGVCVDMGNGIALLEDPMEVVEACAPWARAVHLKDALLAPCEEGFLLGDVPLGEGILDLPAMVGVLRRGRPDLRFSLEMITRDPLKIPCLTERYWATLPDVPARNLARALGLVRGSSGKGRFPRVGPLPLQEQVALEEENIRRCFAYARERLEL